MNSEYIQSGTPDLPLGDINQSLGEFFLERLTAHGNRIAQVDAATGKCRTYNEIRMFGLSLAESMRYGFGSEKWHLGAGSCISICSENSIDFCIPLMASIFLGVASAPLNPTYTERELRHALDISKPKVVFCSESKVKDIVEVAQTCEFVKQVVVMDEINKSRSGMRKNQWQVHSKVISINDLLFVEDKFVPSIPLERDLPKVDLEETALIMCSSGTTGLPKGVMLSQRNLITAISHLRDDRYMGDDEDEVFLLLLPLFHAFGTITCLKLIAVGQKSVLMARFEAELFLESIQRHKVNALSLVPPLLVFLAKHPLVAKYDLSSVIHIICGAAPLGKGVQEKVEEMINMQRSKRGLQPIMQVRQGYGLTETTLAVLSTPNNKNKFGSVGSLAPGTQGKVVDLESGKALGPNKEGELCFRGHLIMKGYAGDPAATAAMIDRDGWLHTGDVGYYDNDGFFYIVDRLKELIKYKGFQVPPAELEALLLTHPDVEDAAVIGIPDEVAGELPLAFVVKRKGKRTSEDDIIKFVAGRVSPQKRLHGGVKFVDSIPKTASGKILRRELRARVKSKL